jgi:hypothetical protein
LAEKALKPSRPKSDARPDEGIGRGHGPRSSRRTGP